jgi:hypothetical protein
MTAQEASFLPRLRPAPLTTTWVRPHPIEWAKVALQDLRPANEAGRIYDAHTNELYAERLAVVRPR